MVNLKKYSVIAALPFLFSCSDTLVQSSEITEVYGILQPFEDEENNYVTRTQIDVSADDKISYKWGVGDVLGIYPDAGTQVAFQLSASSLSADGLSCKFDGGAWGLKTGHSYYAYFPFSYDCFSKTVNKSNIPVSYLGQKQVAFNNTENAGQYDFNAAPASASASGGVSFNFKRLGALLRVKFALPQTATYKKLILKTGTSEVIPVSGTVDLAAATIAYAPATYASSLTIDLNNVSGTVGETAYVYLMLPPMTLKTQGVSMTATLEYDDKSTTYNLCTAGTTTLNTPDFKADTRYKRDAVYVSGDPEGNMSGGNDEEETADTHQYVDLGLLSGTLWATCNVGASTPEEYGDFFAWGETDDKRGTKQYPYAMDNYKYCTSWTNITKYCVSTTRGPVVDNLTRLKSADDAATANWGEKWRTPTKDEIEELINNCTWSKEKIDNYTYNFVATGPNGNSIYFPGIELIDAYSTGNYVAGNEVALWSSDLVTTIDEDTGKSNCTCAWYGLVTVSNDNSIVKAMSYIARGCGMPVRAVYNN